MTTRYDFCCAECKGIVWFASMIGNTLTLTCADCGGELDLEMERMPEGHLTTGGNA